MRLIIYLTSFFLYCFKRIADTTEKRKLDSIQYIINMSGGWPIMREKEEWSKGYVTWQIINEYYQKYTTRSFFNTAYKSDTKNPIRNIFVVIFYLYYKNIYMYQKYHHKILIITTNL